MLKKKRVGRKSILMIIYHSLIVFYFRFHSFEFLGAPQNFDMSGMCGNVLGKPTEGKRGEWSC